MPSKHLVRGEWTTAANTRKMMIFRARSTVTVIVIPRNVFDHKYKWAPNRQVLLSTHHEARSSVQDTHHPSQVAWLLS